MNSMIRYTVIDEDGDECSPVQQMTPRGVPLCIACGNKIPVAYRRLSKWFCRDRCAAQFGEAVANKTWIRKS